MAGRIPQEFLDQLLVRADLVEIIHTRVPLRRAGREFTACCPFNLRLAAHFTPKKRRPSQSVLTSSFTTASAAALMVMPLAF